jgi:hypothetical protein
MSGIRSILAELASAGTAAAAHGSACRTSRANFAAQARAAHLSAPQQATLQSFYTYAYLTDASRQEAVVIDPSVPAGPSYQSSGWDWEPYWYAMACQD